MLNNEQLFTGVTKVETMIPDSIAGKPIPLKKRLRRFTCGRK